MIYFLVGFILGGLIVYILLPKPKSLKEASKGDKLTFLCINQIIQAADEISGSYPRHIRKVVKDFMIGKTKREGH